MDRFLRWGDRMFSPGVWHRVPFQPILYLTLWGATLRLAVTHRAPIQFDPFPESLWIVLGLGCPPLALLAWWLIARARWSRAALAGLWIRLGADIGQFTAVLTYHVAAVLHSTGISEARIYSRYCVAAILLFLMAVIVRDVWAILATDRVAHQIRRARR